VQILLDGLGIAVGLTVGIYLGFTVGQRFESRRRLLWWALVPALAIVWTVDLLGLLFARPELSIASLGLMAGMLTGVKYGAFPQIRIWEKKPAKSPGQPAARLAEPADPADDALHAEAVALGAASPREAVTPGRNDAPAPEGTDASQGSDSRP
jgi:hypothetical protein